MRMKLMAVAATTLAAGVVAGVMNAPAQAGAENMFVQPSGGASADEIDWG